MRYHRPTQKELREAEKHKQLSDKYIWGHFPGQINLGQKKYGLLSWGQSGHEKGSMAQYREVAPKGRYIYKRKHGITAWYKEGHYTI